MPVPTRNLSAWSSPKRWRVASRVVSRAGGALELTERRQRAGNTPGDAAWPGAWNNWLATLSSRDRLGRRPGHGEAVFQRPRMAVESRPSINPWCTPLMRVLHITSGNMYGGVERCWPRRSRTVRRRHWSRSSRCVSRAGAVGSWVVRSPPSRLPAVDSVGPTPFLPRGERSAHCSACAHPTSSSVISPGHTSCSRSARRRDCRWSCGSIWRARAGTGSSASLSGLS